MSNRAYVTALLLLVLTVSLAVLAARWMVIARRVPLHEIKSQVDYAGSTNASMRDGSAAGREASGSSTKADSPPQQAGPDSAAQPPAGQSGKAASFNGLKLDLNSASAEQLTALPGIGEVLALRIIEYRQQHGQFKSVEDLLGVDGIGEKKLAQIKGYIYVR